MRWILGLVLALSACAPAGPRWVGENIHVVDGYWVDTEVPCLPGAADCATEIEEALRALPAADSEQVIGAALGGYPNGYIDASGSTILTATAGLVQPAIVIFDLADGRRRLVGLLCSGPVTTAGGALVEPERCWRQDFSRLAVGREPGIDP